MYSAEASNREYELETIVTTSRTRYLVDRWNRTSGASKAGKY